MGEAMDGAGGMSETSVPSAQFCYEPKTTLEIQYFQIERERNSTSHIIFYDLIPGLANYDLWDKSGFPMGLCFVYGFFSRYNG